MGKSVLVPAITRRAEIQEKFRELFYTDDLMYYSGSIGTFLPEIHEESDGSVYDWAIVDGSGKLLGYIAYSVDWYNSRADSFGLISFDKGNPLIGQGVYEVFRLLIDQYKIRKIEWRMVGGNPVEHTYDHFCEHFGGIKHVLKEEFKDRLGVWHDEVIYEIFPNRENEE